MSGVVCECVLTVGLVKGLSVVVLVASVFFDLVTLNYFGCSCLDQVPKRHQMLI